MVIGVYLNIIQGDYPQKSEIIPKMVAIDLNYTATTFGRGIKTLFKWYGTHIISI